LVNLNPRAILTALLACATWVATGHQAAAQILFVGDDTNGHVQKFDALTGAFLGNFATITSPHVGGMAYGPNGNFFVAHRMGFAQDPRIISELNPITGALIRNYDPGTPATALAFTAGGDMLVTSYSTGNIRRLDLTTGASTPFASLFEAVGIAVAGNGDVFVSSFALGTLSRYDSAGVLLGAINIGGLATGLSFGRDGFLYVPVESADHVLRVNPITLASSTFINAASGGLDGPRDLSFGYDGNLYVISGWNDAVKKYDGQTGAFLGNFVPSGGGGMVDPHYLLFGPTPVPEPSSLLLAGLASAGIARLCRCRQRNREYLERLTA
jgi:hypothetical protein